MKNDMNVIAYFLPQFHTIPENDEWWGEGFTEWTNVKNAKPLFRNHIQPKIPTDLGYYNLLDTNIREKQAKLALEAGISAFCYWHYWFSGKQLLEKPFKEIIRLKKPDFPFCLAWANHSWERKYWSAQTSKLKSDLLIKQDYGDIEEIDAHFYELLDAFKDPRYFRIKGKLLFVIYDVQPITYLRKFIERWRALSIQHNLPGFYFVAHSHSVKSINQDLFSVFDGVNIVLLKDIFNKWSRRLLQALSYLIDKPLLTMEYSKAISKLVHDVIKMDKVYPTIFPNWDASPRLGSVATILKNSTPELFYEHVKTIKELMINRETDDKIVFLKSWNEWAEGNYMEPDSVNGRLYIDSLKKALNK